MQQPWKYYKLNDSATDPWHFRVSTTNGSSLFVLRITKDDIEVFLLSPAKNDNHLKVLDDAYDMYAVTTNYTPNLEFRRKDGEILCRTKCTALRSQSSADIRWHGGYARKLKLKTGNLGFGNVLGRYLATFYSERYGPGITMV